MKTYSKSLFIFRRDLRLADNTALNAALGQSQQVVAAFIFDPRQIEKHPYQSRPALQFMLQAIADLERQFIAEGAVLNLFYDRPEAVISRLQKELNIEAVFVNRDYTPFSRQRDAHILQQCLDLGLDFHSHADLLLNEPEQVLKTDGAPYQIFTPFYQRARQNPVALPQALADGQLVLACQSDEVKQRIAGLNLSENLGQTGGRTVALALLQAELPASDHYRQQRDFPETAAGSGLSAYLKFGCCSVREAYYAVQANFGGEHGLLRQFYWRDFFTHIAFHFPHVFGHAFHRRYDAIKWQNDQDKFWAWANGRTGFPLVDAGMRELLETGLMHNRLRMVTASFLVKDLHIDWRWGERFFAQHLLDYDPSLNNGNWQWAASTGCDAQPYFRIFNPWLQQRKFDPDCRYIKRWLPELRDFPANAIHQYQQKPLPCLYPRPMVDHARKSREIKTLFQNISS